MLTIGWFSTGRDEAARQLLQVVYQKIQGGEIDCRIDFVFSNREPGEDEQSDLFLDLVRSYRIPLVCFSSQKFKGSSRKKRAVSTHSSSWFGQEIPAYRVNFEGLRQG